MLYRVTLSTERPSDDPYDVMGALFGQERIYYFDDRETAEKFGRGAKTFDPLIRYEIDEVSGK